MNIGKIDGNLLQEFYLLHLSKQEVSSTVKCRWSSFELKYSSAELSFRRISIYLFSSSDSRVLTVLAFFESDSSSLSTGDKLFLSLPAESLLELACVVDFFDVALLA